MLTVYVRDMEAEWGYSYKEFRPTGRWKTVSINGHQRLYAEHQGWIFKRWYESEDIIFEEKEEFICECN